jgi:DNA-binding IclR family transcriptional regulator
VDRELDLLLGRAIDSLVKLNLLVYLQAHPGLAQAPEEIAGQVQRPPETVAAALAELAELKLVARFPIGRGRLAMYGSSDDPHIKEILELLRTHYQEGGETRAQLVRKTLRMTESVTGN